MLFSKQQSIDLSFKDDDSRINQLETLINHHTCYLQMYLVLKVIGRGQFGKVFLAKNRHTNKQVAIKIYNLKYLSKKFDPLDAILEYINSEIKVLQTCNNRHLVKCYGSYRNKQAIGLILQYCGQTSLMDVVVERQSLLQSEAVFLLKQVCLGLIELHRQFIIHRDLKLENIVVKNGICKIVDLGLCKRLGTESEITFTMAGTDYIQAPQVQLGEAYGLKADIYSLGIIYLMMIGKGQIQQRTAFLFYNNKTHLFKDKPISTNSINFIQKTIARKSLDRISWKELIKQPIFEQYDYSHSMIQEIDNNFNNISYRVSEIILDSQIDSESSIDMSSFINTSQRQSQKHSSFIHQSSQICQQMPFNDHLTETDNILIGHQFKKVKAKDPSVILECLECEVMQYHSQDYENDYPKPIIQITQLVNCIYTEELIQFQSFLSENQEIYQHYICIKKAEFLLNKNIKYFQQFSLLSISLQKVLTILYLISLRAFLYINKSLFYFQTHNVRVITEEFMTIGEQINQKYKFYHQKMKENQSSLQFNIKKSFFQVFKSAEFKVREQIIESMIVTDQDEQKQINLTYKYIKDIISLIHNPKLKQYLLSFRDITSISLNDIRSSSFQKEMKRIVNKYYI